MISIHATGIVATFPYIRTMTVKNKTEKNEKIYIYPLSHPLSEKNKRLKDSLSTALNRFPTFCYRLFVSLQQSAFQSSAEDDQPDLPLFVKALALIL